MLYRLPRLMPSVVPMVLGLPSAKTADFRILLEMQVRHKFASHGGRTGDERSDQDVLKSRDASERSTNDCPVMAAVKWMRES